MRMASKYRFFAQSTLHSLPKFSSSLHLGSTAQSFIGSLT